MLQERELQPLPFGGVVGRGKGLGQLGAPRCGLPLAHLAVVPGEPLLAAPLGLLALGGLGRLPAFGLGLLGLGLLPRCRGLLLRRLFGGQLRRRQLGVPAGCCGRLEPSPHRGLGGLGARPVAGQVGLQRGDQRSGARGRLPRWPEDEVAGRLRPTRDRRGRGRQRGPGLGRRGPQFGGFPSDGRLSLGERFQRLGVGGGHLVVRQGVLDQPLEGTDRRLGVAAGEQGAAQHEPQRFRHLGAGGRQRRPGQVEGLQRAAGPEQVGGQTGPRQGEVGGGGGQPGRHRLQQGDEFAARGQTETDFAGGGEPVGQRPPRGQRWRGQAFQPGGRQLPGPGQVQAGPGQPHALGRPRQGLARPSGGVAALGHGQRRLQREQRRGVTRRGRRGATDRGAEGADRAVHHRVRGPDLARGEPGGGEHEQRPDARVGVGPQPEFGQCRQCGLGRGDRPSGGLGETQPRLDGTELHRCRDEPGRIGDGGVGAERAVGGEQAPGERERLPGVGSGLGEGLGSQPRGRQGNEFVGEFGLPGRIGADPAAQPLDRRNQLPGPCRIALECHAASFSSVPFHHVRCLMVPTRSAGQPKRRPVKPRRPASSRSTSESSV